MAFCGDGRDLLMQSLENFRVTNEMEPSRTQIIKSTQKP